MTSVSKAVGTYNATNMGRTRDSSERVDNILTETFISTNLSQMVKDLWRIRRYVALIAAGQFMIGTFLLLQYATAYSQYPPGALFQSPVAFSVPQASEEQRRQDILRSHRNESYSFATDLAFLTSETMENETEAALELFLEGYEVYCRMYLPIHRQKERGLKTKELPACPCRPATLVGRQNLTETLPTNPDLNKIVDTHPEVTYGGHWKPRDCAPRQKIAIVIPYRNRTVHLRLFLGYMIPFLQRQLMEFSIFVVEQDKPAVFNKAALMNVGFLEVSRNGSYDCYFFHDVDTLPEDDRNFYTCTEHPRQLGRYVSRYNYRIKYDRFVGGGAAFTAEQYKRMNGVSNKYYGWGGEDDDIYFRILQSGMNVTRFPLAVAPYTTIEHEPDIGNPLNRYRKKTLSGTKSLVHRGISKEGLNNVHYTIGGVQRTPLYTQILVQLPPPPKGIIFTRRTTPKPKRGKH